LQLGVSRIVTNLNLMETAWLVPLAMVFGVAVGVFMTAVIVAAFRRSARAAEVATTGVPDGVAEVIDALESAGVVLDPSNIVVSASQNAMSLGLVWNNALVHTDLIDAVDRVRRTGEPFEREVQLTRGPFGEANLHVFVRVARLGVRYVLLLADDRSESHRIDDVRRDFIANISHELKTPIGAIGLLSEALAEAADDPAQVKRFAARMDEEADRLSRITKELIELSRLQAAEVVVSPDPVDVRKVVSAAMDENRVQAEQQRIALVLGGAKHAYVSGDPNLLRVAVHNLVANAIQYSSEGSRVGVGVNTSDGAVEIAVTDQGIGIADEDRDRVFERFYRVDPARSRHTGGTGLGLSIVKHIVQNHGGDVRVWSQPGRGSTFTIRLPEAQAMPLAAEA
jgi:two-component system sensor histidine kinase SenX3